MCIRDSKDGNKKKSIKSTKYKSHSIIQINYKNESSKSIEDLPECMKKVLYKFQKQGVAFGIKKSGRLLLGDEMGVGKTIQAIALCSIYKENWPVLIICPPSLKFNWRAELLKWLKDDGLETDHVQVVSSKKESIYKVTKFIIGKKKLLYKEREYNLI